MKRLLLVSLLVLGLPAGALAAGENPDARLCMHLIATDQYLDTMFTTALAELTLGDINQDLTAEELTAAGGYGYVILCAYNITRVSAVEFALDGWPTGRPVLPVPGLAWEDSTALKIGDPWAGGGIVSWGGPPGHGCDQTETYVKTRGWWGDSNTTPANCKIYPFGYFPFNLAGADAHFPIELNWAESAYSVPADPHVFTLDCTNDYVEDPIPLSGCFGCVLGGTWTTPIVTKVEPSTWSTIKSLYRSSSSTK